MPENKKTQYSAKGRSKRKKQKKAQKTLIILGIVLAVLVVLYVIFDSTIANMYTRGSKVPQDIRTADEISDDVLNILVCGLDWEEDRSAMMTDVIMYVTLDAKAKKISVLQIPRDTYIDSGTKTGKINNIYWNGKEKDKIMNTIKAVNEKFSLPIDHYVTLDMAAFITMVDAIEGGLSMYVPCPIIAKDEDGKEHVIIDKEGWYKVSGETAEAIVRNRNYGEADIKRLEVQGYFYAAIIKYFKEIGLSDSLKLMPRFTPYITTDLHWSQMASIAATGLKIEYSDMSLIKPPVHGGRYNGQDVVALPKDRTAWLEILNTYFRPYQTSLTESDIKIPDVTSSYSKNYGITNISVQTVAEILGAAEQQEGEPAE